MKTKKYAILLLSLICISVTEVWAESDEELARKVVDPLADLITVPVQHNWDFNAGPNDDALVYTLKLQPVIPFSLSEDWSLITRTILPFIYQEETVPGAGKNVGLSDTTASLFFAPKDGFAGIQMGAGPIFLLPTATDDDLGAEKLGIGPTAVALVKPGRFTIGVLGSHLWSVAGSSFGTDVSATQIQPFASYTTESKYNFQFTSETSYDWETDDWAVPLNANVSKLVRLGPLPVNVGVGLRYWAESSNFGPSGLGVRFTTTLLLPK